MNWMRLANDSARRRWVLSLFFGLLLIYNSNTHVLWSGDSAGTRLIPLSILLDHSVYLDSFACVYMGDIWPPDGPHDSYHFMQLKRGHWLSAYPIVTPLIVTPIYVPLGYYVYSRRLPYDSLAFRRLVELWEKLSSSVVATLSALLMFFCFNELGLANREAAAFTLIYALGSSTWTIGSQALWQHGASELFIALTILAILRTRVRSSALFVAGLAAGLAVMNRPPNAILVAAMGIYVIYRFRRQAWKFLAAAAFIASPLIAYNLYYFGSLGGGYGLSWSQWSTPIVPGLMGILLSPSRGLLVYTPWVVFSLVGFVFILTKPRRSSLQVCLTLGTLGELVLYAKWWCWWGATGYGPRLVTDLVPLLVIALIAVIPAVWSRRLTRVVFLATVLVAFIVQALGAYLVVPQEIAKSELWSVRNAQLVKMIEKPKLAFWSPSGSSLLREWRTESISTSPAVGSPGAQTPPPPSFPAQRNRLP